MNIRMRWLALAASATLLGGIAMVAEPALAGVSPVPRYTNVTVYPVAGYFASDNGGSPFTHIEGYIGSNGTGSLANLGQSLTNGGGVGLCNQTDGNAIQIGDQWATATTINVTYGIGTFSKTPAPNGDLCHEGVVSTSPHTLLGNVPVTDTVAVQVLYSSKHAHNGCSAGQALFEAEDVTANPGVWYQSPCVADASQNFTEADAGVDADTQNMSAPADNLLAVWAHLGLTNAAGVHGSFQSNSAWTAFPVNSSSNGLASGSQLLVPQAFSDDHFELLAGSPTG